MPTLNTNTDIPTPTVDAATYYDVGNQQLHLVITYTDVACKPHGVEFKVITSSSATLTAVGNGVATFPGGSNTGTAVMPLALTAVSGGGQIIVSALDTTLWESSPPSVPWQIPAIDSSPFTSPASASFNSLGAVEVTWTWIPVMGATAQQVALTVAEQPAIIAMVENTGPTATATFTMAQANNLFTPSQDVAIQCTPITAGLWASPVKTRFTIPRGSLASAFPINTSPLVSSNCAMTSLYAQGSNNMQVWWATPAGAIETAQSPLGSWDEHPQQFSNPSTVAETGSCLASIYVNSTNQLVWWIAENGAIGGQVNSGKGWAPPGTGPGEPFPFCQANTASTVNGGSITSLLLGSNGTILFWVDPKGAVGFSRWYASTGWQPVSNALPPGTASTSSQLTTLSAGSTAYLFCVASDGSVVGGSWPDPNSKTLGLMSPVAVAPSKNAAPNGGLVSISVSAQELAILWTTPNNNIEFALLSGGASSCSIRRPLTLPQSVMGGTSLAVFSMGANQCSVWWIGQPSDLRRTILDFTKLPAASTPDWPVFEELGPGSCNQTRSLIVQKQSESQINVLYVNTKGALAGLSYALSG